MNQETKEALMADSNFVAGMQLGWNLCEAGKDAEFVLITEKRGRDAAEACADTWNRRHGEGV